MMNEKLGASSTALVPATATEPTRAWLAVIPDVLQRRHFHIVEQTPASATELQKSVGYFCDDKIMPQQVESTLFEAFIEDDYDGKLHLTTINNEEDTPLGLIFWREVPEEEMKEWIDYEKLAQVAKRWQQLQGKTVEARTSKKLLGTSINEDTDWEMNAVRRTSLTWLAKTVAPHNDATVDNPNSSVITQSHTAITKQDVPVDYAQAWVKIELLAVRPQWWGQRVGSLLLACALYQAWHRNNSRVVLHVAGSTANVPAVHLYDRFGFVPAPGIFRKPDKDIFVLGNIGLALESLTWSETLKNP